MTRSERRTPAPLRRPRRRPPAISGVTRTRWASHAVQPEAPPPQRRLVVLRVKFFLLTAWTRPGYDSPRRRRLATSTAGAAAAAAAAQRCVTA